MQIGLIGLGRMGYNLALNMRDKGHQVVAFNRTTTKVDQLVAETQAQTKPVPTGGVSPATGGSITGAHSLEQLVSALTPPRAIWVMLPAGDAVDEMLARLTPLLQPGDIVIDGGNSFYKDTLRHAQQLQALGLHFVDVGTSGGIEGARYGACTMVGADPADFARLEPLLRDISVPDGCLHCGPVGSGHFVKMVHNGVEYGMMQAIGEGFEVLERSPFGLNLPEVARVWNHGSVVRSWLMELLEKALKQDQHLDRIRGVMHSSGEGLWTAQTALEWRVPAPVITQSVIMRYRSEQPESFTGKVVAALRNQFGGHAVDPATAADRTDANNR